MIYFLRSEQDGKFLKAGWIKIGVSSRLSVRLKQIAVEIGHVPTVLAVLDGAFAEEHALHVRFKSSREFCEWFGPCEDLLRLIEMEGRPWDGTDEACLTGPVKLAADTIEAARIVSAFRGETMTDMLSDILRPILARMEREETAKRAKTKKGKGDPKV